MKGDVTSTIEVFAAAAAGGTEDIKKDLLVTLIMATGGIRDPLECQLLPELAILVSFHFHRNLIEKGRVHAERHAEIVAITEALQRW